MGTAVTQGPGTAVQKKGKVGALWERFAPQMDAVLPKHLTAERQLGLVNLVMTKTPKLKECLETPGGTVSFFTAIMNASRLGLEIGHRAHLLPFSSKGIMECVMVPDYRGLVDLAVGDGKRIRAIDAECVFGGDEFDYGYGLAPHLTHKPSRKEADHNWGTIVAAYAIVRFADDGAAKFIVLEKWELEKIRASSRAKDAGPWVQWPERMCMKSAVKRLCNLLPQNPQLAAAIELDNRAETGEIGRVLPEFDTEQGIIDNVKNKTQEKMEALSQGLAKQKEERNGGDHSEAEEEPQPQATAGQQRRDEILGNLEGLSQAELHAALKEGLAKRDVKALKDMNALVSRVTGLKTYQEITTPLEVANVLYAAEVTEEREPGEGS